MDYFLGILIRYSISENRFDFLRLPFWSLHLQAAVIRDINRLVFVGLLYNTVIRSLNFLLFSTPYCDVRFGLPVTTFVIPVVFGDFPIVKWFVLTSGSGISKLPRRPLFRHSESIFFVFFFGGLLVSWLFDFFIWTCSCLFRVIRENQLQCQQKSPTLSPKS